MNNLFLVRLIKHPGLSTPMGLDMDKIQDDGNRFIIHGKNGLYNDLKQIFDHVGLGVSVTESDRGAANILYTENNRDIVLRMLYDQNEGSSLEEIGAE